MGGTDLNTTATFLLYDELWNHLTNDAPAGLNGEHVESFLFMISDVIQTSDTLAPHWTIPSKEKRFARYLASEGVLLIVDGQVSFSHQTFLDYARRYCTSERSFISDLENSFQGLEIRSKIKIILEYERFTLNIYIIRPSMSYWTVLTSEHISS